MTHLMIAGGRIPATARARHRVQSRRAQALIFTLQSHPISGWLFYLLLT